MLLALLVGLVVLALCCAAEAEEEPMLGMGRRHYLGEGRLDITYTTELETPHIDWADRYVHPISAFAIPSVMEGRTLVELMQRLSMTVDAVTIDPAWDVNKWTMSFGEAYGARAEQQADGSVDYGFMYKYLEEDLSSPKQWDVMIMHGILGWDHLPETIRAKIPDRVRNGMGLVLVGPFGKGVEEISPLVPAEEVRPAAVRPGPDGWQAPGGAWEARSAHPITRGVPLETLPGEHLRHRKYRAADRATVLAEADGDPVVAVREVGKGRVVAFGYENYGLAPFIRWNAYGEVGDAWWETWYSLFLRAIAWAAGKESAGIGGLSLLHNVAPVEGAPRATVQLTGQVPNSTLSWQIRTDAGEVVKHGRATLEDDKAEFDLPVSALDGGRHLVDVFLDTNGKRSDWASAPFTVQPPVGISLLDADPKLVEEGKPVKVEVRLNGRLPEEASLVVELADNYQRVIDRAETEVSGYLAQAELTTDDLLTHIGWIRATIERAGRRLDRKQVRVDFATPDRLRVWDDYEVNVPFYGPQNSYHWLPLLDEQYRRAGVTWLMEPERNFRFTVLAQPSGLGVYHYHRKAFEEQMEAYWRTKDRRYLIRRPCLHQDWRQTAQREMTQKMERFLKYRPFHYYIYDEPSLTSYTRPFDFCYSPETIAAYREWLQTEYSSVEAVNQEWGTSYRGWDEIDPPTTEEAQRDQRIPPWADFRRFMDRTFAGAMDYTQQVVGELDPGGKTLVGGTQMPTPFNGTDWWLLSHSFGILEPYFGIDEFRSFNPDLPIIQACGYQDAGPELEEELWRRFFRGQRGATVFWNYTMHDPDLALNSQGVALARAFGVLRGRGVARLIINGRRDASRIAILHSQSSLYAAWIQDGDMRQGWRGKSERAERHVQSNAAWQAALHRLGFQFHYLSYAQVAKEGIDRGRFDVLVLPDAIALSDAEVKAVAAFVKAGGTVLADGEPGGFDEHCKRRSAPTVQAGDRVHLVAWPAEEPVDAFADWAEPILAGAGITAPALVSAPVNQLVRYRDGEANYIAVIDAPADAHRIGFDCRAHVYELRRSQYLGETDEVNVPAGEGRVAVYALLPAKVEALHVTVPEQEEVGKEVRYAVKAEAAADFRHVFAVQAYGPDGKLRHMYSTNLDAATGAAVGRFRLAHNDAPGQWRLVATDAATGVRGEGTFWVR